MRCYRRQNGRGRTEDICEALGPVIDEGSRPSNKYGCLLVMSMYSIGFLSIIEMLFESGCYLHPWFSIISSDFHILTRCNLASKYYLIDFRRCNKVAQELPAMHIPVNRMTHLNIPLAVVAFLPIRAAPIGPVSTLPKPF